jgi:putative endonuclease
MTGRQETGELGEKLARDYLKKKGYRVVETNFNCRRGEIDIVTKHKDWMVFVEVRSKSTFGFGTPEESITTGKKRRVKAAVYYYLSQLEKQPKYWRIDVIVMEIDENGKASRLEHIQSAIGELD